MAEKAWKSRESEDDENGKQNSISVRGMQFAYEGQHPLFYDFNLNIPPGSRCLLVGANGSGSEIASFSDFSISFVLCC